MGDDYGIADEEMDAWLEEWKLADQTAADVLARAWPPVVEWEDPPTVIEDAADQIRDGVEAGRYPFVYFAPDLDAASDDVGLWLDAATSSIAPIEDPTTERGQNVAEAAAIDALQYADWLALVVGLARRGVGAALTTAKVVEDVNSMEEIEGEIPEDEGVDAELAAAIAVLEPLWTALGALDDGGRLTELGLWGLPRALFLAWSEPEMTVDPG